MIVPAQKEPDLAIAGLALIVIFGLLIWHDNPIRSDRPFDPSVMQPQYPHTTGYAYDSWLWQDPFSFDSSGYVQKDQYDIEVDIHEEAKSPWPKSLKLRKKLDLEGDNYSKANSKNDTNDDGHDDGLCTVQFKKNLDKQQNKTLKILLSLVNVRPNTVENKEIRARHRYAVIAGLMEKGYYPSHPDRLNFCASQNASSNSHRKFDVRWEHFSNESKENIIAAWVDSNAFFKMRSEEKDGEFIDFVSKTNSLLAQNDKKNFYIFDWIGAIDEETKKALKEKKNIEVPEPAQINQKFSEQLVKELVNRRITKPSEIAIITEQDSEHIRELANQFTSAIKNGNEDDNSNCQGVSSGSDEIKTFSYFKGLDAYQQIINKQDQNEDYQAARQWDARLSVTDLHNPPVGPAQYDYLRRIAREISQTHDVIDLKKRVAGIKAVGIFGSDFYDKLLILKALRTEMPNLLVFTTDLDAQMLHPQHWRWTRNLVVASPFDLRLNEKHHQKLFPAFRDSRQTEIFYHTLRILESGKDSLENAHQLPQITDVPPLIFEIGRNGSVRLGPPVEDTKTDCFDKNGIKPECNNCPADLLTDSIEKTKTTIHPANNSLEQSQFQIKLFFGITLALILIVANFRPHSGALFFGLLLSSLVIFVITLHAITDVTSEPLSFANGISLWPTIFIQMIVILLFIAFIFRSWYMLESNFASLNRRYFKNRPDLVTKWSDQEPKSIRSILKVSQSDKPESDQQEKQQASTNKETMTWSFYSLAIFLIFASGGLYAFNDIDPENFPIILCVSWLTALVALCFWIEYACPQAIKAIIFWTETDSYYQQLKLKFDPAKIIVGLLILLASIGIIFYVPPDLKQIDSGIRSNGSFLPAMIIYIGTIIAYFLSAIKICHPDAIAQDRNTQKFIILQEHDGRSGLWHEYYQYGRLHQILFRVAVMWLFFAIIETILFYLLPPWPSPCRGAACDWNQWIGTFGFIFTMLLTFFVLDAVRLNYYFIRKLRTKHPLLLDDVTVLNTEGLTSDDMKKFYHERKDNPLETLEKIVTLVAERTKVADKLIYYPLLCIMLMLFARTTYFDNQDFPLSKGITFGAGISLLIFSGFMIRYEAQKLKQAAVMSAEHLVGNTDPDGHHCVRKLKEINGGIFQPMLEQPVMRALLLILASVGLFAGEYLMLAGF